MHKPGEFLLKKKKHQKEQSRFDLFKKLRAASETDTEIYFNHKDSETGEIHRWKTTKSESGFRAIRVGKNLYIATDVFHKNGRLWVTCGKSVDESKAEVLGLVIPVGKVR